MHNRAMYSPIRSPIRSAIRSAFDRRVGAGFNPVAALFGAGEQGGLWNIGLMSSLFQDSAGTTPVTAVEQPVGLVIDQSQGGNPVGQFVSNGDNESAVFSLPSQVFANVSLSRDASPSGAGFAGKFLSTTSSSVNHQMAGGAVSMLAGKTYRITGRAYVPTGGISSFRVYDNSDGSWFGVTNTTKDAWVEFSVFRSKATNWQLGIGNNNTDAITSGSVAYWVDNLSIQEVPGNHLIQATSASRPTYSARYNLLAATATLSTQTITVRAGSHTIYFTGGGSVTLSGVGSGTFSAGTNTFTTTAGSLTVTVSGSVLTADIRLTIDTVGQPAYQRVTTSTDYDTTGFYPYLRCDGADDGMYSSAAINFSSSDEMSVFAGITKMNNTTSMLVELSSDVNGNAGSFYIVTGSNGSYNWTYASRGSGSIAYAGSSDSTAPVSAVFTGLSDISTDACSGRINGTAISQIAADQGSGNYGNFVLNVGRRNNSTIPLNGRIYSLIVRGALTSGTTLTNTERWIAQRMPGNLIA